MSTSKDSRVCRKEGTALCAGAVLLALALALAAMFFPAAQQQAYASSKTYSNGCTVTEVTSIDSIVDESQLLKMNTSNMSVQWASGSTGKTISAIHTDYDNESCTALCVARGSDDGWSVSGTVCTVTFSDAATIGEESVDVIVTISNLVFDAEYASTSNASDYVMFFVVGGGTSLCRFGSLTSICDASTGQTLGCRAQFSCDVGINVVWSGTQTTVDLPFFMALADLDAGTEATYTEAWESTSGFTGTYYVYQGHNLNISTGSSGMKFSSKYSLTDGSDSYTLAGAYAPTEDGSFSCTFYEGNCLTSLFIYNVYSTFDPGTNPAKSVAVNGSSSTNTASEGDTVTWSLSFTMPEFYVDTVSTFSSLVWTDALPDETSYVSAKLYKSTDGGSTWTDVTSSSGTPSQSSGTVSYAFSSSWLKSTSNYDGALYKLSITTTANASISDVDAVVNNATLTVDGVDYEASATIYPESGSLTIGKTVKNSTSVSASKAFSFTVTLASRSGASLSGSYTVAYSDGTSGTVKNGGTISLKGGQSATISGLPAGATWTVSESSASGYAASASSLSGTIAAGAMSTASFTNTYSASGSWTPSASKTLKTSAGTAVSMTKGQFGFQVKDSSGTVVSTGTSAADGSISFSSISYDEGDAGSTYTYTLSEVAGSDSTISYDASTYTVKVSVTDDGDGTLTTTAVYYDSKGNALNSAPTFANVLKDGSLTISKTVSGTTLGDGTHYDLKSFDVVVTIDGESQTLTLDSSNDWTVTLENVPALSSYTVEEVDVPAGYTLVSVTPSSGTIEAAAETTVSVVNSYLATGSWTPVATKTLDGGVDDLAYYSFNFVLADEEGKILLEGTSDSSGTISFDGEIGYSTADGDLGVHTYTLYETDDGDRDIDYDDAVWEVQVTVTDDGDGTLTATASYNGEAAAAFANAYSDYAVDLPATGQGGVVAGIVAGVALVAVGILVGTIKTRDSRRVGGQH